jgi:hypothetical protein
MGGGDFAGRGGSRRCAEEIVRARSGAPGDEQGNEQDGQCFLAHGTSLPGRGARAQRVANRITAEPAPVQIKVFARRKPVRLEQAGLNLLA